MSQFLSHTTTTKPIPCPWPWTLFCFYLQIYFTCLCLCTCICILQVWLKFSADLSVTLHNGHSCSLPLLRGFGKDTFWLGAAPQRLLPWFSWDCHRFLLPNTERTPFGWGQLPIAPPQWLLPWFSWDCQRFILPTVVTERMPFGWGF